MKLAAATLLDDVRVSLGFELTPQNLSWSERRGARHECKFHVRSIRSPLTDLQFLRRHAEVDLNATVDDTHRIRVHRKDRRERPDFAGLQIEARAVPWALHQTIF